MLMIDALGHDEATMSTHFEYYLYHAIWAKQIQSNRRTSMACKGHELQNRHGLVDQMSPLT